MDESKEELKEKKQEKVPEKKPQKKQELDDNKKEKTSLKLEIRKHKMDILFWVLSFFAVIIIYVFICSKDLGFLLVMSSFTQLLSFSIIYFKVEDYKSVSGLSGNSLAIYAISLICRLLSTVFYDEYVPEDCAGMWAYVLAEFTSLFIVFYLLTAVYDVYKETADKIDEDLSYYYFGIPCFILAYFLRSDLNDSGFNDFCWAFAMYYESFAIVPQIVLFVRKKGQIETFTSHYVALCGLSRLFSLIFWCNTFHQLEPDEDTPYGYLFGYVVVGAQALQLLFMADYYYLYFKSLFKGQKINTMDI